MSFEIPEYLGPTDNVSFSNAISVPLRDSPETVRGWRLAGLYFSCVPDPCYPPDPAILRAARESDPDLIYMVVRWVFKPEASRSDGGIPQVFTRHALGRHVTHPAAGKELFFVDMPAYADFAAPNQLDRILPDFDDETVPAYAPLEWDAYWAPWTQLTAKEFRARFVEGPKERYAREKAAVQLEIEGRRREAQKFWDKCLENVPDWEISQYIEKNRLRRAAILRKERAARTAHVKRERASIGPPKLTFDLGGH